MGKFELQGPTWKHSAWDCKLEAIFENLRIFEAEESIEKSTCSRCYNGWMDGLLVPGYTIWGRDVSMSELITTIGWCARSSSGSNPLWMEWLICWTKKSGQDDSRWSFLKKITDSWSCRFKVGLTAGIWDDGRVQAWQAQKRDSEFEPDLAAIVGRDHRVFGVQRWSPRETLCPREWRSNRVYFIELMKTSTT